MANRITFPRDLGWGLLLLVAVIVVYWPVGAAGFVWDDQMYITGNADLLGWAGLKTIWTTNAADVSPLTFTTFWMEHALWGLAPLPYHLVNVLLHAASAILLWRVLLRLGVPGAWLGAALWALHPVQGESVAWVTETKNTQSALFFLLAILFYLRWLGARISPGGWKYPLVLLFTALALASKSSTVILPIVLILAACWIERRWPWRHLVALAPLFFMSLVAGLVSLWTQRLQLATVDSHWARTWPMRIAETGDAIWFYLGKLLWPWPLSNNYPRWQIDAGQTVAYLPTLAVVVVLAVLWLNRASWGRPLFFAFTYFLVALAPALGLLDNPIFRYSLVFDHLQYLAAMGPLALAAAGLTRFSEHLPRGKAWLPALGAGVLAISGWLTWHRAWVFQNEETLWTDTLVHNPASWAAHNNLGRVFFARGEFDAALAHYQQALALNSTNAEAHSNLGAVLIRKNQVDPALAEIRHAIELNPTNDTFFSNLGEALTKKGDLAGAIAAYQNALVINPNSAGAHGNLGVLLFQTGHAPEAMSHFEVALALNPDSDEAHNNLGNALLLAGRFDDAIVQYQAVVARNASFTEARRNLGVAYARTGRLDDAVAQFQAVVRLNPSDAQAQKILEQLEAAARRPAGQK